MSFTKTKKTIR